jgi:hypothetical protein
MIAIVSDSKASVEYRVQANIFLLHSSKIKTILIILKLVTNVPIRYTKNK